MTTWSDNSYKLVSKDNRETFELYDLENDPYEEYDIASGHPEMVSKMTAELNTWLSSVSTQDKLYHIDAGKLATLVASDGEANAIYQEIKAQADKALYDGPNPLDTIFYEGLIEADPRRIHTSECLKDAVKAENLAWVFMISREHEYFRKAREILLAWSQKHMPNGNPISEKELIPMIRAYGLLYNRFHEHDKVQINSWLHSIAKLEMQDEKRNNWQAKRIWLVGYIGLILKEQEYLEYMQDAYRKYVNDAFYADGSTNDFIQRDALHYHASGLWPLIDLAIVADRNGIDLETYQNPEGGTLRKCIDFMVPYSNGEKQHAEFVNSKVEFDRIRSEAGQKEYTIGHIFDGMRAARTFEYYSYFDDSYLPLAFQIKDAKTKQFTTWRTVVNHVLASQEK
jgi:hypothetical protein